jgi:hypothetical protein
MSRSTTNTFTCPCGQVFTGQAYEYVNVADDPHLRYVVLAGLINVATCPICNRRATITIPFVYSDPAYNVLAYVHPRADASEDERLMILEKLHDVYMDATKIREQQNNRAGEASGNNGGQVVSLSPNEAKNMPALKVIFGIEQLGEMMSGVLTPEDRLGRLALNTQSRNEAERGQFHDIARKLASEMGCCIEVEDLPDEYTVWIYGARRKVGALMRELATRG